MNALPGRDEVSVLIPAAGGGERLGRGPKAALPLHGRPVIDWLVDKAQRVGGEVIVACAPGLHAPAAAIGIEGGASRQDSVRALVQRATRPWLLLWDAASPFASIAHAQRLLAAAAGSGAAVTCLPLEVPGVQLQDGRIARVHEAGAIAQAQTPQAYAHELLHEVTERAAREGWHERSTVQLVLRAGYQPVAVRGEKLSIKLTTPEDWILAQALREQLQS